MKKILFVLVILLSACAPSASAVATAISNTQIAYEQTQAAAATPTATPTSTPTITPTPDIRIIEGDPYDFLLKQVDFPKEGKYYLPDESWVHGNPNAEIIAAWGMEEGKEYVDSTGRIMGFWADYARGTIAAALPEEIYSQVVFFETIAGSQLAITEFYGPRTPEYLEKDCPSHIGDLTFCYEQIENSRNRVLRKIYFSYRNATGEILGYGIDSDVQWELLFNLAKIILAKLQTAPLTIPSTP
jgi:hypothetical protein